MQASRVLTLLGIAAVTFSAYAATRRARRGEAARLSRPPQPLQRWEDEGGSVPAVNAAVADPALPDGLQISGAAAEI